MRRLLTVALVAVLVAAACAGWKWGGSAQGATGIECSPDCFIIWDPTNPPPKPKPKPICTEYGCYIP